MNLCADTGAREAVFGTESIGLAFGTAEEVDCSEWSGTKGTSGGQIGSSSSSGEIGNEAVRRTTFTWLSIVLLCAMASWLLRG